MSDDARYPLGQPIRPEPKAPVEWVPIDPERKHIERNTRTGAMRNVRSTPPA